MKKTKTNEVKQIETTLNQIGLDDYLATYPDATLIWDSKATYCRGYKTSHWYQDYKVPTALFSQIIATKWFQKYGHYYLVHKDEGTITVIK